MAWRAWLGLAGALAAGLGAAGAAAPDPGADPMSASAILQDLRKFHEVGSVLYIAAHPDDENSRLLAYLAQGRACRTAYLSLTRGDGGQNLIGPELGEELGVIRTQELLGARGIDGARQFFSRARDFGFSKDYRQALGVWDRKEVLADIVRVIRTFRPDVIVTRFPPWPIGTHGQHTASAYLALEAFRLCGDPTAYPGQLRELVPWRPVRILWNSTRFGSRAAPGDPLPSEVLRLDDGGYQPLLGQWYGVLAGRSRSMQATQGMGTVGTWGSWSETFQLLAGSPPSRDLFDGIDCTWGRFRGGGDIGPMAEEVIARFNPRDPAASLPGLLALRLRLAALDPDPVVAEKRRLLDRIVQSCLGLRVETLAPVAEVVPGESLSLRHRAIVAAAVPVRWLAVRYAGAGGGLDRPIQLRPGREAERASTLVLPADCPLSQPRWLRRPGTKGGYAMADSAAAIQPENDPVVAVENTFEVGGQILTLPDEPVQVVGDPARGEIRRRLEVIPPVSADFAHEVGLFSPGSSRRVAVELTAGRAGASGRVRLEAPAGWTAEPAEQAFQFRGAGERSRFFFTVTAPGGPAVADLCAVMEVGGVSFRARRVEIRYGHIPELLYQPEARFRAVSLELAIRGRRVGYLPGAGDGVGESLELMGYEVTRLATGDLTAEGLRGLDAVVLGVRAFNVLPALAPRLPALWKFVEEGGNLIVQYNTDRGLQSPSLAPYSLEISDGRVTDENARVSLLAPGHPALVGPNRIAPEDFDGWVQERARYLPSHWDRRFTPLISCGDPGEEPNGASLLVARVGRGYYVYSGLSWFRELPAGVPGAYRLFANLVSLGR